MEYLVTFVDGPQGIFTWEVLQGLLKYGPESIVSYVVYEPALLSPPSAPPAPRLVQDLAALAVGAWTDIIAIIAPSTATPGQTVNVEVRVKNIGTYSFYIGLMREIQLADGTPLPAGDTYTPTSAVVAPGATQSFYITFTMPNQAVRISIWSVYWTGTDWVEDDFEDKIIALAVPSPEFQGFAISDYR